MAWTERRTHVIFVMMTKRRSGRQIGWMSGKNRFDPFFRYMQQRTGHIELSNLNLTAGALEFPILPDGNTDV